MADLLELVEKHLGSEWSGVVDWLRSHNSLDDIEARLRDGDTRGVLQAIDDAALKFAAETHAAYVHSAQEASSWLNEKLPDALVRYDVNNAAAIAAAQQNQLEWVTDLRQETRDTIHQVIVEGHQRGANPREVARDIRDSIGLAPPQESAVRSYRAALESHDWSNALGRELSSGHSDRSIVAARDAGRALTADQIDVAVERYRQAHVNARAETIARTEGQRNVHAGIDSAFSQAVERGDVDPEQLEGQWLCGPKTRYARPDHRAPELLGQRPTFSELFEMPDGTRMRHPGDPAGGARNCVCCRCTKATRLVAA